MIGIRQSRQMKGSDFSIDFRRILTENIIFEQRTATKYVSNWVRAIPATGDRKRKGPETAEYLAYSQK